MTPTVDNLEPAGSPATTGRWRPAVDFLQANGAVIAGLVGVVVLLLLVELVARPPDEATPAASPHGGPGASVTP